VGAILVVEIVSQLYGQPIHINAFQKFIGIVLITAASLAYSSRPGLQRGLKPVIGGLRWPMRAVSTIVGTLLAAVCWPFKAGFRAVASSGSERS
jgi:hypothetical protein